MIRDFHCHADYNAPAKETVNCFEGYRHRFDLEHIQLQSIPQATASGLHRLQNLKVLMIKDMMYPYAFAGFGFYAGEGHEPFALQLEQALAQGFDSVKMLEGKPDTRKRFGIPICDPILDPYYDRIAKAGMPLLIHLGDPHESWDESKCDPWALAHGRCYAGKGFLSVEELYAESEALLQKHPDLRVIFAHFYFLAEDLDRAAAFLDRYPNACFDLTPGKHYEIFSRPELWETARAFFLRYADRLIYGTDVNDGLNADTADYFGRLYGMTVGMLTGSEIPEFRQGGYRSLALPEDVCQKIMYDNHRFWVGETPKRVDRAAVLAELWRIEKELPHLSDDDCTAYEEVKAYFTK